MRRTKAGRIIARGVTAAALATGLAAAAPMTDVAEQPRAVASQPRDLAPVARSAEQLAERLVREADLSGLAIAIVQGDRVLLARGFGHAQVGSSQRVDADTVFRVASLSKGFAGTVAAQLVEEGALAWDSRIADQLPTFSLKDMQSARNLTVRDILSHRVGLPWNTYDRQLEQDEPYPRLVARLGSVDPVCSAGDCYAYQNIAFSLIGDLVFAATGDFYTHQVEKRLFHPLGMYSATYGRDALEAESNWARPHVRRGGHWVSVRPKESYYRIPPAAGINASIRDMAQWAIAQLGHRPEAVSPSVLQQTHAALVATPEQTRGSSWRRDRVDAAHYGLGWRIYDYSGTPMIFHAGAVQGYRAMFGVLPGHDAGVVLLWNCESGVPAGLFATIIDRIAGLPARDWIQFDKLRARRR